MNQLEFNKILKKIDYCFLPIQVGSNIDDWLAVGRLINKYSEKDVESILKDQKYSFSIKEYDEKLYIRIRDKKEDVIFHIPKISRIHWVLFLLTIFTTLLAGAIMEGVLIFNNPYGILRGVPFSVTLMLILGTHEFGHYFYAQKHNVEATLPYFLPAPPFLFLIGTFGAFIKIKSPIYNKEALLQIGAAGPIAGFIIAVPALLIGLKLSTVIEKVNITKGIVLGDSILMKFFTWIFYPSLLETQDIMLHPIAFAGWIGLLVTMLNLLPVGQLDGGHVAYAMFGKKKNFIEKLTFATLIPLSFISLNWLFWGILIFFLMRSAKHPPIEDINISLSSSNKRIGYICIVIFILCFIPAPFKI